MIHPYRLQGDGIDERDILAQNAPRQKLLEY